MQAGRPEFTLCTSQWEEKTQLYMGLCCACVHIYRDKDTDSQTDRQTDKNTDTYIQMRETTQTDIHTHTFTQT